jgi:hypothetical protein
MQPSRKPGNMKQLSAWSSLLKDRKNVNGPANSVRGYSARPYSI